jgi:NAD(P)-dependent dehydrogenase (short-subunit alcohol dehydrogenase family)
MTVRVIVTGAQRGIGAATVKALRARGAHVVGLDVCGDGDGVLRCDIRSQSEVDAAVQRAVERLGGLDVLINNAGVGDAQRAGTVPDAEALAVLDVNLFGAWRTTAAALPALRASRGRVINVASGLTFLTLPFAAAYCASKRALVAYSDALRLEEGDMITVTTVYPGYIRTSIHDAPARKGVSLEGLVPAERVEDAARALVRAALGPPARDLATTRRGGIAYALLRLLPPGVVDRVVASRIRQAARRGLFSHTGLAAELAKPKSDRIPHG